ncbi:hypothetical protein D9619_006222 [Psilocybe cf. subviscida]|uniref:Uncharacterized protein n=1 Tax=Psilocybe cf. subviscida TaxID=2480587 RepID=A0A8H5EY73_9AGAR|nr:hypothetical protein D9619_006222 [Psilocybe cf. subviscida]
MFGVLKSVIFATVVVTFANAQIIPLGGTCNGIAGPIYGTCITGTPVFVATDKIHRLQLREEVRKIG